MITTTHSHKHWTDEGGHVAGPNHRMNSAWAFFAIENRESRQFRRPAAIRLSCTSNARHHRRIFCERRERKIHPSAWHC
jgi:hypothetical protein